LSAEHKELIKLTLARDAESACTALSRHIKNTAGVAEAAIFGDGVVPLRAAADSARRRRAKS